MGNWKNVVISIHDSIIKAIEIIDKGALQIALVVDENNHLIGTITDGNIRRAILKGTDLNQSASSIMNRTPVFVFEDQGREEALRVMKSTGLHQIPVVNQHCQLVGLEVIEELLVESVIENPVLLMAGGMGTRLQPLTDFCPKPLLKVGNKPILEHIIERFAEQGFKNLFISINYRAEMIENYFNDGSRWGVNIKYIREEKRLGTAGALSLIPKDTDLPLLVMNGDILTKIDFKYLIDFHNQQKVISTMCLREYHLQVPYGVAETNNDRLIHIEEKPIHRFLANAGIYVLNSEVLNYIPKNTYYDMPEIFDYLIKQKRDIAVFPIKEYWLDVGRRTDYDRANLEFTNDFLKEQT